MQDKVLVTVVTHNNHVLLEHFVRSLERHDAGYPYELQICDNSSEDKAHLNLLDKFAGKYKITTCENDRVEGSFLKSYTWNPGYKYYFFAHDDTFISSNGWLLKYIERLKSNHVEKQIENTEFAKLPVGRVGALHQPWRTWDNMMGMPIQCLFVRDFLHGQFPPHKVVQQFKYVDPERVLYTNECLEKARIWTVGEFFDLKQNPNLKHIYDLACESLNRYCGYPDEGIAPKSKYPPGECWNKITMLTEFMNSVGPLNHGFRSIGLEGDGFMEQIDGFDSPWGHKYIHHYGSANIKRFLGKYFGTSGEEIHKKIYSKDKVFLVKCDMILKEYFSS
jgi:hypothetical protein